MKLPRFLIPLLAICMAGLAGSSFAMEKHIVSGSGTSRSVSSEYKVYVGDTPDHTMTYVIRTDAHTSGEVEWNGATSMAYALNDQAGINGTHTGYQVFTHANGDRSYVKFSGKQTVHPIAGSAVEIHFEGTFEWTGGTGMFEYMSGSGTYKGKTDANGVTTYTYEGIANF